MTPLDRNNFLVEFTLGEDLPPEITLDPLELGPAVSRLRFDFEEDSNDFTLYFTDTEENKITFDFISAKSLTTPNTVLFKFVKMVSLNSVGDPVFEINFGDCKFESMNHFDFNQELPNDEKVTVTVNMTAESVTPRQF
jgi:hypothetical protein